MSASKEYKAIKNFIINDLQISKETIIKIIREKVRSTIKEVIRNSYGYSLLYNCELGKDVYYC